MDEEYDDTKGYVGPGIFHVPRALISREENYEGYRHDFSPSYRNLGFHAYTDYNQGDQDWQVKGPWTSLAKLVWEYKKLMLPHSGKLSGQENSQNNMKRKLTKGKVSKKKKPQTIKDYYDVAKRRNMNRQMSLREAMAPQTPATAAPTRAPPATVSPQVARERLAALPANHFIRRSLINGSRMARSKRKFSSRKKANRFRGKSYKKSYGRRKRRIGKRLRRVYKKIKNINRRLRAVPALEIRTYAKEYVGGSIGANNRWMYRVVDNMAANIAGNPQALIDDQVGWNYYNPFARAVQTIYGDTPDKSQYFTFLHREMKTLISCPTNTPTFVEVYLLKPKYNGNIAGQYNPLWQADQGTTPSSVFGRPFNPGNEDPYVFKPSAIAVSGAKNALSYGTSLLTYNPFYDRGNMKDRFKIVKKWKFVLDATHNTRIITIKSKKPFKFRPSEYDGDFNAEGTAPHEYDVAGTGMNAPVQCTPSSRIMVMRWHGAFSVGTTGSETTANQMYAGTTADAMIIRRWFNFKLYKQDTIDQVAAFDTVGGTQESTYTNLKTFGFDSLQGQPVYQPGNAA